MSRILVDIVSNGILQVEKTPDVGVATPFNGKYSIVVPDGASVAVDSSSYVLPVDGGDVTSLAFASLLAQYPTYGNIVFNPLLTSTDVVDLDLLAALPDGTTVRLQTGRGAGLPLGQAPCSTAILAQNNAVAPPRPGCLISDTIDISVQTGGAGAEDFMIWWQLYDFGTSDDVMSDYGATASQNDPAIRSIYEVDQEPAGLIAYLSNDDGLNYTAVGRLEPVSFCVKGTNLRIAFKNTSSARRYIASYAIFF